jgi:hypothetical protein
MVALQRLIEMYQPSVIHTLDPQPFEKIGYNSNVCPDGGLYDVCFDNLDHTAVARYVDAVLANYHGPNGTGRHTVVHYKGYSFVNYPRNLGTGNYWDKRAAGETYRCSHPGDSYYSDGYDPYYAVQYERYPGSTNWVERAKDGRLVAVNVQDRQVKLWYENSVGGSWTGPVNLGGGAPIAPHLTLLKRPDGRLQIFATRLPLGMEQATAVPPYQEVITAVQHHDRMTFGAWQVIGAPDDSRFTGVATAAIDGSGRTFVFARDGSGVPVYAYQSGNSWTTFALLYPGLEDILDGIAAITTA